MQIQLKSRTLYFVLPMFLCFIIFLSSCQKDQTNNILTEESVESTLNPADLKESSLYFKDDAFHDMIFKGEERNMFGEGNFDFEHKESMVLEGTLQVSDAGEVSGQLEVSSTSNNTKGTLELNRGLFIYKNELGIIQYNPFDGAELSRGDGQILDFGEIVERYSKLSKSDVSDYPLEVQFLTAFMTVTTTNSWSANTQFAKVRSLKDSSTGSSLKSNCTWWDRTRAGAVATVLSAGPASVCASLIGVCAAATTVTLGWVVVPCVVAVGFCGATVGFSWTATYEYMLDNWLCPPALCYHTPPNIVYTASSPVNNRVTLQWTSVSGAQSYQVVQDVGYPYPLATTSGTSMTISGMGSGWYRFGVRTICNNTVSGGITWHWVYNS